MHYLYLSNTDFIISIIIIILSYFILLILIEFDVSQ